LWFSQGTDGLLDELQSAEHRIKDSFVGRGRVTQYLQFPLEGRHALGQRSVLARDPEAPFVAFREWRHDCRDLGGDVGTVRLGSYGVTRSRRACTHAPDGMSDAVTISDPDFYLRVRVFPRRQLTIPRQSV
jgi:hypothetical protein